MAYIGLISDTHGVFDDKLKKFLEPVDEIWHAGDFGNIETADAIAALGQKAKARIRDAYSWQFIADEYERLFLKNTQI